MQHGILAYVPKDFPHELISEMLEWEELYKSPYGYSYYNAKVDWGFKPHNSLRVSDHWNFVSKGKRHCETSEVCPDNTHWTIARFDANIGKYVVIKSFVKQTNKELKIQRLLVKRQTALNRAEQQCITQKSLKRVKSDIDLRFLNLYFKLISN